MKILLFIGISAISLCSSQNRNAIDLQFIRAHYEKSDTDKTLCEKMIKELSKETENPIKLAYLGALQTIWAKFTSNPFSKLKSFKMGTNNIEKAFEKEPKNIEIRFLRLSIQKNTPGFLGYKDNIKEDKAYLKNNHDKVKSEVLRKIIDHLMVI